MWVAHCFFDLKRKLEADAIALNNLEVFVEFHKREKTEIKGIPSVVQTDIVNLKG